MPGNLPLSQTEGERERSPLQSKEWETILDAVSHPVEQPVLLTTRELQRYYSFWIPATKEIFFFFELTFQPPVFKLALWGFQEKKKLILIRVEMLKCVWVCHPRSVSWRKKCCKGSNSQSIGIWMCSKNKPLSHSQCYPDPLNAGSP